MHKTRLMLNEYYQSLVVVIPKRKAEIIATVYILNLIEFIADDFIMSFLQCKLNHRKKFEDLITFPFMYGAGKAYY